MSCDCEKRGYLPRYLLWAEGERMAIFDRLTEIDVTAAIKSPDQILAKMAEIDERVLEVSPLVPDWVAKKLDGLEIVIRR